MPVAVRFTLDDNLGFLDWRSRNGKPDLSLEEANVIAAAETAAALRSIAAAISELSEGIRNKKVFKHD